MMNTSEKVVLIASGLYDMRRLLVSTIGPQKFAEKVQQLKPLFEQIERANQCNTLEAMQRLLKTETVGGDPVAVHVVCAVAVELIEPSLPPTPRDDAGGATS